MNELLGLLKGNEPEYTKWFQYLFTNKNTYGQICDIIKSYISCKQFKYLYYHTKMCKIYTQKKL